MDDIRKRIDSEEEENNQLLSDDDTIEEAMAASCRSIEGNDNDKGREAVAVQKIIHTVAINSFTRSSTRAKENGVSANDISVLKRLQEIVFRMSFQTKTTG